MKAEPRRVLYIITDSGVGGSERVLLQLLSTLDRDTVIPVGVLILKNKREMAVAWEKQGVPVYSFGMKQWPTPSLIFNVVGLIKKLNPDVVHAFLYHACQVARLSRCLYPHFKLVTSPRVNYRIIPKWTQWIDRVLRSQDDLTLAESTATKEFLTSALGYRAEKMVVVLNGVKTNEYQFNPEQRAELRKKWEIGEKKLVVGAVGRLHHQKGFDVLIRAMSNIPSAQLVIVGEGPEENMLTELARKQNVDVLFLGRADNMADLYSTFDIYVQSSRYEGMSNALLEAMSAELPIVATNVDGTLDVARDKQNMLLVPPDDVTLLAQKVRELVDDSVLRKSLAAAARKTALENTTHNMIRKFENVYLKLS